jgi:hypothetical protein
MAHPVFQPSLPAAWPYPPRGDGAAGTCRAGAALSGLGGGWSLYLRGSFPLEGAASGTPLRFGRGGIQRLGDLVLRPYRRGGLLRHLNERIYLSPARFVQEYDLHRALWQAGFPTVEPLGYGFRRCLWGVEGIYLTRFAEASPWPECWDRSREVIPQVARLVEALAAWGILAPDLNATNLLVALDGGVLALDWDRSRFTQARDLRGRYRERLLRSLRKLGAPVAVAAALEVALS